MKKIGADRIIAGIEKQLGYSFKNRLLCLEALTHKSYFHENKAEVSSYNERLEFLGDAVIGLIIVDHIFLHEDRYSEAVLAKIKSYIVSEPVFAEIAGSLSLGRFILLGKGESSTGGMHKKSILADAFEALMGAVYLDAGYEKTCEIVMRLFRDRVIAAIESGDFFDYKTELQERTQLLYGILPEYKVIKQQGEEHKRIFTVAVYLNGNELGSASGHRKKVAETLAAKKALDKINS